MLRRLQLLYASVFSYSRIHEIRQDSFMIRAYIAIAMLAVAQCIAVGIYYLSFPEVIVMHSNIYFGIDLIAPRIYSILVPAVSLGIVVVHGAAAFFLFRVERDLARVLLGATVSLVAILGIDVIFIVNMNN